MKDSFRRSKELVIQVVEYAALAAPVLCLVLFGLSRLQSRATDSGRLRILVGLLPPYVNEQGRGREVEVITRALSHRYKSTDVEFFVQPFSRHWSTFVADKRFAAVATVPAGMDLGGYSSCVYIHYQNGVGSMSADPSHPAPDLEQLKREKARVAAFAGAAKILNLDRDWFNLYIERNDQEVISFLLLTKRVDAVIEDRMIFQEYNRRLGLKGLVFKPLAPTPYHMVFRDAEVRDVFNEGIKRLSGELAGIDPKFFEGLLPDEIAQLTPVSPCP